MLGGAPRRLHHVAGETFDFDASHVHRMHQDSDSAGGLDPRLLAAAVADGQRTRSAPDGTLRRESISYAEELRPVESRRRGATSSSSGAA